MESRDESRRVQPVKRKFFDEVVDVELDETETEVVEGTDVKVSTKKPKRLQGPKLAKEEQKLQNLKECASGLSQKQLPIWRPQHGRNLKSCKIKVLFLCSP